MTSKAKPKFDARKLMELAIDVMRKSVNEPRDDGKVSPKVGAVLYKADGTVETACRGELRYGDHAEFTLLERKNRASKLDNSKLFVTLEPCAPGAREPPKCSCAERVFWARIKEIWVGIEDPDPTVDRRGIKYLQDHGVTVEMFPRDLQETIQAENKEFIAQAMERAAAAEEERPEGVILSPLENAEAASDLADLATDALEQYREAGGIAESIGSDRFNRRMIQQGLLTFQDGRFTPTGFGLLLFGKEPRVAMPQAGLLATLYYPDGTEEPRNFDGPMVLIPSQLEKWLRDKLPNVIDRSSMQRREVPPIPFEMLREAVVNALVHRDYSIRQAKCQLEVTPDTITMRSPGGPLTPITLKQLQAFNAPMLSRNPELHYVFARMGMAEERGIGIRSLKNRAEELGLPLPRYRWEDPYLALTLYRSSEAATRELTGDVLRKLNADEKEGWEFLSTKTRFTRAEYEANMGIDKRKAQRHLRRFAELELIRPVGAGRTARYEVVRK